MDFLPIDEERIKEVLSDRQGLINRIRYRLNELYESISDSEEIIQALQLRSCQFGESISGSGTHADLSDILEKQYTVQLDHSKTIRTEMWKLTRDEESINRIWICYNVLPRGQFEVLDGLYIKGQTWDAVELELQLNHKKIVRLRKIAIDSILSLYDSDLSNSQIAVNKRSLKKPKKKRPENKVYQLSLNLTDNSEGES